MINKNWVSWCWQLGVFGAVVAGAIASGFECAQAQSKIVPDSTLGAESSVVLPYNRLPIEVISGGAIRGGNLFHSFLEFNISSGRGAYFFSPNVNIQNILARVTGSNRSEILGTLGTYGNSNPNLFLINPNGIIFGASASLDVGGSFLATTANAVRLGDTGLFSASQPTSSNLLSVNPSAFLFNSVSNPIPIIVNSSTTGFQVPDGRSLLLLGGDVQLDGGTLFLHDDRVELGGVSGTGTVGLNIDGNYLSLSFPEQVQLADVSLTNGSKIGVFATDGSGTGINVGNQDILSGINITAKSVAVTNGTGLLTTTLGQANAGSITINARDLVTLDGVKVASTVSEGSVGNGGNINITTGSLALTNGALLTTGTSGRGNAGSITINARDLVGLDGVDSQGNPSGVFTSVSEGAFGLGGNINITTGSLALTNHAQLVTATIAGGNAGDITINALNTISLDSSSVFSNVSSNAIGNGGNIKITTGSLTVRNGARVETNTAGVGNAGSITINVRDTISLDGIGMTSDGTLLPSSISSGDFRINDFTIGQGTASSVSRDVSSNVFGNEGNINIATGSLKVTNGAQLNTNNYGKGSGGEITINARDLVIFDGLVGNFASGALSRVIAGAEGKSGNINITTGSLALTHGAQLDTTTLGHASAGNITINARDPVTFDHSSALSTVAEGAVGTGGTIDITTGALSFTNGAQLSASTAGQGDAGNVTINARDPVTFDGTDGNVGNVGSSGAFSQVESTGVGKGGTINITTGSLTVRNGAQLSARTAGQGNAGNVTINARNGSFTLTNGALLTSLTTGQGNAGSVTVDARDTLQLNNAQITTNSTSSNGGDITLTAKDIQLRNNSLIRTDLSSGQGSGGNITLTANTILALEDSDILAFASQGRGGNITFNTRAFLSDPLYRPTPPTTEEATFASFNHNGRVDVNASGAVSGGNITGVPDPSFIQNSLSELPQNLINPNVLIANSCIARSSKQQGTFTITGAGGLPNRPGDAVLSTYPTGDVRSVRGGAPSRPWHKGDPIVEPQGLYHLPSGHLVLSRECSE